METSNGLYFSATNRWVITGDLQKLSESFPSSGADITDLIYMLVDNVEVLWMDAKHALNKVGEQKCLYRLRGSLPVTHLMMPAICGTCRGFELA